MTTICIFSTLELVGKKIGGEISPYTLTAWRFLIGGLMLLPFAVKQHRKERKDISYGSILTIGVLGILNVCASMLLLQLSIFYGKASLSAILVSINPLFVSIFAMFVIREKLNFSQVTGLVIGLVGILIIIFAESEYGADKYKNLPLGIIFAIVAAMTFALYTVLTKKTVINYGNIVTNSLSFIFGAMVLFVIIAITGKELLFVPSFKVVAGILYLGIVLTGIAYLLYFEGMKGLAAGRASMYFFLKPVIASLLAWFFLSESLTALQIVGIGLVILSLAQERVFRLPSLRKTVFNR